MFMECYVNLQALVEAELVFAWLFEFMVLAMDKSNNKIRGR